MFERVKRPGWFHFDRCGGGWLGAMITRAVRGDHAGSWLIGLKVSIVTFADRRSGSSGVRVEAGFGPWRLCCYPLTWANEVPTQWLSLNDLRSIHQGDR